MYNLSSSLGRVEDSSWVHDFLNTTTMIKNTLWGNLTIKCRLLEIWAPFFSSWKKWVEEKRSFPRIFCICWICRLQQQMKEPLIMLLHYNKKEEMNQFGV
jgi:hypothetical protein